MAPNASGEVFRMPEPEKDIPPESIRVENKIYSAKKLSSFHPGGPLHVKAFAGRDATEAFLTYHRRRFPHTTAKPALDSTAGVNDLDIDVNLAMSQDFIDLCERVNKVLPRTEGYATWSYFFKAALFMATSMAMEGYMHYTGNYRWWISTLVGWNHALIAMNIAHHAVHSTLSKKQWVNDLWSLSMSWIGGSTASWIHQHNVQHHIHTNDIRKDPDIQGRRILRLNPAYPLFKMHFMQKFYFFLLIFLYGFSVTFSAFTTAFKGIKFTKISPLLKSQCLIDVSLSSIYFFRWYILPQINQPGIWTLVNTLPVQVTLGWYIAFFFTISHNFDGTVQVDSNDQKMKSTSLLYKQVAPTSNVGGSFHSFMHGGLNYQIEHHLFPRINPDHYPKIAPIVKEFCEERGIPYRHFSSVRENTWALFEHLFEMGNKHVPKSAKDTLINTKQLVS